MQALVAQTRGTVVARARVAEIKRRDFSWDGGLRRPQGSLVFTAES